MMNTEFYEILCKTKSVEVKKKDKNGKEITIDNPNINDYIRMMAADGIWANEGSIITFSQAFETILFIFVVDGLREKLSLIMKSKPTTKTSSKILTIINMDNVHFYVCQLKNNTSDINQFMINNHKKLENLPSIDYNISDIYENSVIRHRSMEKNRK